MSGAITASVGINLLQSHQQGKAAKQATASQQAAAAAAAEQAAFDPYNVSGAFGQGVFDREAGTAGVELTPQMQQLQQLFGQQAGQFAGQGQTALGQQAGALGQQFLGGIQADPFAAAQTQFGRMEDILNPARQRQREALEGRLLKQGRLGSTGGALQQQGFETGIEEARQRGLFNALQQSQGLQAQQVGLGTQLGLLGQQQQDVGFQQAQARLGALTGIEQQGQRLLELGAGFGGRQATAGAQQGAFGMQGATAGTAAQLGAAAGQAQAFGKAGSALGDFFNQPSQTTGGVDFSESGMSMTQQQMLDEQNF